MADNATKVETQGVTRTTRATGVGARVRDARLEAGLTQAELGGSRFSKEYVSQVELGKTKPSDAAIAWFAKRLGVDRSSFDGAGGASARAACEAGLARAEAEIEAHRYDRAVEALSGLDAGVDGTRDARLRLRLA